MEDLKNNPKEPHFEKGMLVRLKDGLPEDILRHFSEYFDTNADHVVLAVANLGNLGKIAWLGPSSMPQKDIDEFNITLEGTGDPRYDDVVRISIDNLRTLHN